MTKTPSDSRLSPDVWLVLRELSGGEPVWSLTCQDGSRGGYRYSAHRSRVTRIESIHRNSRHSSLRRECRSRMAIHQMAILDSTESTAAGCGRALVDSSGALLLDRPNDQLLAGVAAEQWLVAEQLPRGADEQSDRSFVRWQPKSQPMLSRLL